MPLVHVSAWRCTLKLCGIWCSGCHHPRWLPGAAQGLAPASCLGWKRWQEAHWAPPAGRHRPEPETRPQWYTLLSSPLPGLTRVPSSLTPVCCSHSSSNHSKYCTRRFSRKLFPWRNFPMMATMETSSSPPARSRCIACRRPSTLLRPSASISTPSVLASSCFAKRPVPCSKNSTSTVSSRSTGSRTILPSLPRRTLMAPSTLLARVSWPCSFLSTKTYTASSTLKSCVSPLALTSFFSMAFTILTASLGISMLGKS
mmetsp:Transcript_65569/g.211512  ORF Transcript_65569/g.211512 Transcript_65569/m.211512 type:complete len:257 (+) Transcript_65569:1842-2612(+)